MYYCDKLDQSKNDVKHTWSVIKDILHKSEKEIPNYFTCNDKKEDDPQTIANEFNSYFDNCCSAALESMPPVKNSCHSSLNNYLPDRCQQSIFLNPIEEFELVEMCKSLKNSNAYDFNYLNVNIIKKIIHTITKPLP